MFENATVNRTEFPSQPVRISGFEARGCLFENCTLAAVGPPGIYSHIASARLIACRQHASGVSGAILDDVIIEGLGRVGRMPLFLSAVVFRHVELRGAISFFKLGPAAQVTATSQQTAKWIEAHSSFYRSVDWALDISRAEFTFGPDLHFVPGHLIRRDPESQVLVRRRRLEGAAWRELPWGSSIKLAIQWFLEDGPFDSAVLVAARRTKAFATERAALEMLRSEGLAE